MKPLRIALAQINTTVGDMDGNRERILDAARRALLPTVLLFGDGDQDERRAMWVNSIQFRSGALSKAEMAALGGPSASGIPNWWR